MNPPALPPQAPPPRGAPAPRPPASGLAVAVALVLWAAPALGFEALVRLSSGEPVRGAIVQILGHPGSVTTDADGRFVWRPDPPPPFYVLVVLPGDRYTSPVFVESVGENLVIEVEALAFAESVTITSGAVPHTEATPGSAPSLVPGEVVRARQPPRLVDVLEAVPGAGRSSDYHAAVPSLRGLSRGRTVLLLDGARVTTERRAGASASFLDPFFLDAVEVVRGPSPVAYGSDAFGGVVHARTRRPGPEDPLGVRLRVSGGAGLPEGSLGAEVSGSTADTGLLFQARRRSFGEYRSPDGTVPGSGADDYGFLFRGARDLGHGTVGVGLQFDAGRDVGRPRLANSFTSYPEEDSLRLTVDYEMVPRWGFARLDGTAYVGAHRLLTRREAGGEFAEAEVAARDLMFRLRGVRSLGPGRFETGVEILSRFGVRTEARLGAGSESLVLPPTPGLDGAFRREASVFGQAEFPLLPGFSGSGGARISAVRTRGGDATVLDIGPGLFPPPVETRHAAVTGFAALRADLVAGFAVTGQVSRGFRDPSLSDRYFVGLSGRGVVHGNPALEPERSWQTDLALRFDRGPFRGGLFGYVYRISDLVERFEASEDEFFFRNRGQALVEGVELEVQIGRQGSPLTVDLALGLTEGSTGDGAPLDEVPGFSARVGARRSFAGGGFAEVVVLAFAADSRPGPTEIPVDAHARLDAAVGVPLTGGLELRISGRNLLDAAYPVSADSRAVLSPGRAAAATLLWTLGDR